MNGGEADRTVEATARRQHGVFSRAQAEAAGATRRMIERRRSSGAWLTLERGVYALHGAPFTWLRQAKAAELSVPGSGLSHRAAAHLHGVEGYRAGPLDVSFGSGRARSQLAVSHQVGDLATVIRTRSRSPRSR